jgi:P-type Cu+ transporter
MQRISGSLDEGRITFGEHRAEPAAQAIDPVCGMTVERGRAPAVAAYQDHSYFFCSTSCKSRFEAEPERYVKSEPPTQAER